jgi:hypothetical protein
VAPLNIQQQQLAELQRLKDMQRQLQEQQQLLEAQLQMAQQQQQLGLMSQAAPTSAASAGEGSPSLHHSSSGGSSAHTFPPVGEPAGFSASPATLDSVMSSLGYGTTITTAGPSVGPPRAGPAPVVASAPAPAAMTAGMPALMPPLALDAMAVNPLGGVNGSYQVYAQPASLPVALPQSQGLPLAPGAGPFVPGMPAAASIPSMPAASIPVSVPLAAGNNSLQLVSARPAAASFPPPGPQAAAAAGRSHAAAVAAAAVAATNQDPKLKGMGPSRRFRWGGRFACQHRCRCCQGSMQGSCHLSPHPKQQVACMTGMVRPALSNLFLPMGTPPPPASTHTHAGSARRPRSAAWRRR